MIYVPICSPPNIGANVDKLTNSRSFSYNGHLPWLLVITGYFYGIKKQIYKWGYKLRDKYL